MTLCSTTAVKATIETVGRWTDAEIGTTITEIDETIYIEGGKPLAASWSEVGKIDNTVQSRYYVGEEDLQQIDTIYYGTTTKVNLYLGYTGYKQNLTKGMIEILPYASSGISTSASATQNDVEIHYVPKIYNKISLYRTCKKLLEQLDTTSGGAVSKELGVINAKLKTVEDLLAHRVGVQISSDVETYNSTYGVNKKKIIQNHDRNLYVGSAGWTYS